MPLKIPGAATLKLDVLEVSADVKNQLAHANMQRLLDT